MAFKIITADERLRTHSGVKMIIVGSYGVGKTSLLKTLDTPALCLDLEAGLLAVQDWKGPVISLRTWTEARDIACLIGGPNPADHPYSARHFESLEKDIDFSPYSVIFIDSMTVASRLCFAWCKQQPEAFSERTGASKGTSTASFATVLSRRRTPCFGKTKPRRLRRGENS